MFCASQRQKENTVRVRPLTSAASWPSMVAGYSEVVSHLLWHLIKEKSHFLRPLPFLPRPHRSPPHCHDLFLTPPPSPFRPGPEFYGDGWLGREVFRSLWAEALHLVLPPLPLPPPHRWLSSAFTASCGGLTCQTARQQWDREGRGL